jgi:esterase
MTLHYREYGDYSDHRPSLILLHGLLGSSANWHSIARQLGESHHVLVPDLRNHGRSPHLPDVRYPALAADVARLIDDQGLDSALLVGHSMGGKTAMWLALEQPEKVSALVVVDIAPVVYRDRFADIFEALHAVDLVALKSRQQADAILARSLDDLGLRQYLLQNLHTVEGQWCWRANLPALVAGMQDIVGFPLPDSLHSYPGAALFIHGGLSDYVTEAGREQIRKFFPHARLRVVPDAGHWVYAERPKAFIEALLPFINQF